MCNISGALKPSNKKLHNSDKLKLLALLGSERGKDSFGMYYNNTLLYHVKESFNGVQGNTEYIFRNNPFPEEISSSIVMMHNRQATVGLVTERAAHPYIIDGVLVGMKNGTIYNHEELAKKYKIDVKDYETDSELMLMIIARYGTKVLKEYIGGCALAWSFLEEPDVLYLWKGSSMEYNKVSEERPLFYTFDTNNVLYFNSLEIPLKYIINCKAEIHSLKENTVTGFKNGKIISTEFIDRSKMSQSKHYQNTWYDYGKTTNVTNKKATVEKVIEPNPQIRAKDRIYYYKGLYRRNGHTLEGIHNINMTTGEIVHDNSGTLLYFYKGWWLKDNIVYERLTASGNKDNPNVSDMHRDALVDCEDGFTYKNGYRMGYTLKPVFGYANYTFKDGKLTSCTPITQSPGTEIVKDPLLLIVNYYVYGTFKECYYDDRESAEAGLQAINPGWSIDWKNAETVTKSLKQVPLDTEEEQMELLNNWTA